MRLTSYQLPVTRHVPARPSRQAGSTHETAILLWAFVYAWAGWLWGGMFGWPWLGAVAGFIAGMFVGTAMGAAMLIEVSVLAPLLALVAWWLAPRPWLPHAAAAICAIPLACWLFLATRDAARNARARRTVAGADTLEALIPLLGSKENEVAAEACARLARMDLPPDERARVILKVAAHFGERNLIGEPQWLTVLVAPLVQAAPPPREALLLLYEHLGWVSAGRWPPRENSDERIQRLLFDGLPWDSDAPLRRASQARLEKGWNVDRMVKRLLGTNLEAGARMAEEAFPAGALSAATLLRMPDARAAALIEREIARALTTRVEHYERIIEAALGLPPARAFPLLERTLEWDPADYCIEGTLERGLMKDAQPALGERCSAAPAEAASFLAAVRAHIDRLGRYDWNAKFSPGWHPKARIEMWTALADGLRGA